MTTEISSAPETVSAAELKRLLDQGTCCLIDVREPVEFEEGHIPGARLVPLGQLNQREGEIDRSGQVVVMCQTGSRGKQAQAKLRQLGVESVVNLEGGIERWKEGGYSLERTRKGGLPLLRQVQLIVGGGVLLTSILAVTVHTNFAYLSALAGLGLVINGSTGWCGLAILLSKMPWNRVDS